mmetsp:Transcript_16399/g.27233  ORF Transcript_16399/g.27233 Transcript_16399/m.27233 type:complete len:82 (+) Transcript_16399:139-384(+)
MMNRSLVLLFALFASASAFCVQPAALRSSTVAMQATRSKTNKWATICTTAAVVISTSPLVALAEEMEGDYEYGAVSAPIGA